MKRRIVLSDEADRDVEAIWDYTADQWSVDQAESYVSGLDRVLRLLAEQPHIARERPEIRQGARLHPYRKHLIMFVETAETLTVFRVIHAQANWQSLLGD